MMLWRAHSRAIYLLNEYGANLPEGAVIDGDGDVINALDRIRNALIKADIAVELAGPIVNAARVSGIDQIRRRQDLMDELELVLYGASTPEKRDRAERVETSVRRLLRRTAIVKLH